MPNFRACFVARKKPSYEPLGETLRIPLIEAIGQIDAATVNQIVPIVVDGVHPVNLMMMKLVVLIISLLT